MLNIYFRPWRRVSLLERDLSPSSGRRAFGARAALALLLTAPLSHAATLNWNSDAPVWTNPTGWTPFGPPTSGDEASFNPDYHSTTYLVSNPMIPGAVNADTLNLFNNFLGGTFLFYGGGNVILGGSGGAGLLNVGGFGTQIFKDPGLDLSDGLLEVGTDAGLTLTGNSRAANIKAVFLNGGTLTLDDSGSPTPGRLPNFTPLFLNGGTISVVENNSSSFVYKLGDLVTGPGYDMVKVQTGSVATPVDFANGGAFSLRGNTYMAINFSGLTGIMGGSAPGDPHITFSVGTPNTMGAGPNLISNTAGGLDVGFATVSDANGTTFATYKPGLGVLAAAPTVVTSTAPGLLSSTGGDFTQFNAPTGTTSVSGGIAAAVLRITPAGFGTLDLTPGGINNIKTNAIMLDGPSSYNIQGSSGSAIVSLTGSDPVYFYVNNRNATLMTNMVIGTQAGATNIVGPGTLFLTGGNQIQLNGMDHRLNLLGGVLRATPSGFGMGAPASTIGNSGTLAFRGGVLEITKGSNGTGSSADFTRSLDYYNSVGSVNWSSADAGDNLGGSGGFSAWSSDASVNIGGAPTPGMLTWNQAGSGFVMNGYALKFGSVHSDHTLTWYNPIDLGTNGSSYGTSTYAAREINVTRGTGTTLDKTVLAGVISGPKDTDLTKTGRGTLELGAYNTFQGGTIIQQGTLRLNNVTAPSLQNTRQVIIGSQGTLLYGQDKQIASAAVPITMVGGSKFDTAGHSDFVGTLTLSGTSILDLGAGASQIRFQDSSAQPWTGTLNIYDWTGLAVTGGGTDQVYFDSIPLSTGLTTTQLSQINFYSGYATGFLGTAIWATNPNEITVGGAIPEPGVIVASLALLGVIGYWERRKLKLIWVGRRSNGVIAV